MSMLNPQSILSSRNFTNHVFKSDFRKQTSLTREKINMNFNKSERTNRFNIEEGMDESKLNQYNISHVNSNINPKEEVNKNNKRGSDEIDLEKKINSDDQMFRSPPGQCYICFNRIFYSKNCIYFYFGLVVSSIVVFLYSLFVYFAKTNELPIIVCEVILASIIMIDMILRIYITGCKTYFTKCLNWLDLALLILTATTIFLYLTYLNDMLHIEDISFALIIFIRNTSQLLRLIILLKNQKEVRKNIEEIIHFSSEFNKRKSIDVRKKGSNNDVLSIISGNVPNNSKKKHSPMENIANLRENEFI